jgi:hypothetical protein
LRRSDLAKCVDMHKDLLAVFGQDEPKTAVMVPPLQRSRLLCGVQSHIAPVREGADMGLAKSLREVRRRPTEEIRLQGSDAAARWAVCDCSPIVWRGKPMDLVSWIRCV